MGKHFLTRLAETEKVAKAVIAERFPANVHPAYRAFYRHPEMQAAIRILLERKITLTSGAISTLLRYPLRVRVLSRLTGGVYPKELRDAKKLRSLAGRAWDLAFELDEIEVLFNAAAHGQGSFSDRVRGRFPSHSKAELEDVADGLRAISRVLEELAEKGPPIPEVYSTLTKGAGKQPNPYIDAFVYKLTRAFRKAYRAPLFNVTAHLLNAAMNLPDEKKYTGRKVFDIYRRLQGHARRKRRLKLI